MLVSLRLPDDLVSRIDAVAGVGGRSGWIRGVLEARLSSEPAGSSGVVGKNRGKGEGSHPPPEKISPENKVTRSFPDDDALCDALRQSGATERQLRDRLGWEQMRVSKTVNRLLGQGRIRIGSAGFLELE